MGVSTRLWHHRSTQKVISINFFTNEIWNCVANVLPLFVFSKYITDKLLQYCEKLCDATTTSQRKILNNAWFSVPFESSGNLIQFQKTAESLVVSKHPIKPIENISNAETELPNIYPLNSHISIDKENFYELQNIYRKCNGSRTVFVTSFHIQLFFQPSQKVEILSIHTRHSFIIRHWMYSIVH